MQDFRYTAVDKVGNEVSGDVRALDVSEAQVDLEQRGLYVSSLVAKGRLGLGARFALGSRQSSRSIPKKAFLHFAKQLALMLKSHLPLTKAVETLLLKTQSRVLKDFLSEVHGGLRTGKSLSESIEVSSFTVPGDFLGVIRSGEATGQLYVLLLSYAEQESGLLLMRRDLRNSLIYPFMVVFFSVLVFSGVLIFIVPQFEVIIRAQNLTDKIPSVTRFLFSLSAGFRQHLEVVMVSVLLGIGLSSFILRKRWMSALGRLPFAKMLVRNYNTLAVLNGWALMLRSGLGLGSAIALSPELVKSTSVRHKIRRVGESLSLGMSFTQAMTAQGLFSATVTEMLNSGERSGDIQSAIGDAVSYCKSELDNSLHVLKLLLEPAMIVFLAVLVGGIIMTLFLPLVQILQFL